MEIPPKFKFQYLGLKIWESSILIMTSTCANFGAIWNFDLVIFLRNFIELPYREKSSLTNEYRKRSFFFNKFRFSLSYIKETF